MEVQESKTYIESTMRNHSFSVGAAQKYGLAEAIILRRIQFLISSAQIQQNKQKYHQGKYWAHIWRTQYGLIWGYLSHAEIESAFRHLQREGVIEISSFTFKERETDFWVSMK